MSTITSANSTFYLSVRDLFPIAQKMQGYAADDAFTLAKTDMAETQMGVDGRMSAGWVPAIKQLTFRLQADSPSVDVMDALIAAQDIAREVYFLDAVITLPATGKIYTLTKGVLKSAHAMPDAKKVLGPQEYELHFEQITAVPV